MSWVRDLKRDYGDFVIDVPNWEILDQGVTVLWGPSQMRRQELRLDRV
jgi:sulfate transport system ATP-binding protein/putative spermidine/putrescine transport system ATP-binding protein